MKGAAHVIPDFRTSAVARSEQLAVLFGPLRLIHRPRGRIVPWSEMGLIRKTLVVVGAFIIVSEVLGYLLGRLYDVLFFSVVGVAVVVFFGRLLYRRKWR